MSDFQPVGQVEIEELVSGIRNVTEKLLDRFDKEGGFGQELRCCPISDELFTVRDQWIVFKRVPRLRLALFLGGLIQMFVRSKQSSGFGYVANPRNPLSFFHQSFFNDLLIWEILWKVREFVPPSTGARITEGVQKTLGALRGNGRSVEYEGMSLEMFSYFSPIDAEPSRKGFFRSLVKLMDVGVPDNDTTSVVFSAAIRLADLAGLDIEGGWKNDWSAFIPFLKEHVYRRGKIGMGSLSYENGVEDMDRGVYTWILEKNNDVDATSNVNILGFLATIFPRLDAKLKQTSVELARGIFDFLRKHAHNGKMVTQRFQQFYPMSSALFYWHRLSSIWADADAETRCNLDPEGCFQEIDKVWRRWTGKTLREKPDAFNPSDLVWASPFLEETGLQDQLGLRPTTTRVLNDPDLRNSDTFHVLYPIRMICIAPGLLLASHLSSLNIRKRKAAITAAPKSQ